MNAGDTGTLLLRLAGPMQSWGLDSRFDDQRDTGLEPSKSGVLGLVCAALGKPRDDQPGTWPSLAELADLKMGVRVLREGTLRVDFQTAGGGEFLGKSYGVCRADGTSGATVLSHRHYLADADFLVGLEGPLPLLRQIEEALNNPVWQLSLGRKSYVPTRPVALPPNQQENPAVRTAGLEDALRAFVDPQSRGRQRFVLEASLESTVERRQDVPLSFRDRAFAVRGVETRSLEVAHE